MPNDNIEKTPIKDKKEEQVDIDNSDVIEGIPVSPVAKTALEKLPPEVRREFILMMSHQRISSPTNPIASKISSSHIDKILDNAENGSQREFKSKWFTLAYCVLALSFLVFIFIYLPTVDKALFTEVLKLLLTFLGGLGAGFGIKSIKKNSD